MAYCPLYEALETDEKIVMIAMAIHAIQNDSNSFWDTRIMINNAEKKGVYKNVKFGRDAILNEVQPVRTDEPQ